MKRGVREFETENEQGTKRKRTSDHPQEQLLVAIHQGDLDKIKTLIEVRQVDVNLEYNGVTPLIAAINSSTANRLTIINLLMQAGAVTEFSIKNKNLSLFDRIKQYFLPTPQPTAMDIALRNKDLDLTTSIQRLALQQSEFYDTPDEILKLIFDNCDESNFYGHHKIQAVCRYWNQFINKNKHFVTLKDIVSMCSSQEQAVAILRDEGYTAALSNAELFKLSLWIPDLAIYLQKKFKGQFFLLTCRRPVESRSVFNTFIDALISPFDNLAYRRLIEDKIPFRETIKNYIEQMLQKPDNNNSITTTLKA